MRHQLIYLSIVRIDRCFVLPVPVLELEACELGVIRNESCNAYDYCNSYSINYVGELYEIGLDHFDG